MRFLFNPFQFIAGTKALILGWAVMLLSTGVAASSNLHFDGAIDAHIGKKTPFLQCLLEQFIAWLVLSLIFYLAASILSKSKIRFIDFAGTVAIARSPFLLIALLSFIPAVSGAGEGSLSPAVIITSMLMILPVIWMITLLYNAFTVSGNLKGPKAVAGFIAALLIAEVIGVYLIRYVLPAIQTSL